MPSAAFSAWWTQNTKGSTKTKGDEFTVTFGETYSRFKIIELIPEEKIVWKVLDCNLHWMNNKKEWKDTESSGKSLLQIVLPGLI